MNAANATQAVSAALPYVITLREIYWGVSLVALTMAIHGFGVLAMLRISGPLAERAEGRRSVVWDVVVLVLSVWILTLVHLFEVSVWAAFFSWKHAFVNYSTSYYFALNEFTTLGSDFHLPVDLRLLEGCIATAGLLTFAWSTGAMMPMLQGFQQRLLKRLHHDKAVERAGSGSPERLGS